MEKKLKFTTKEVEALHHAIEEIKHNLEVADDDYNLDAKKHLRALKSLLKKITPTE